VTKLDLANFTTGPYLTIKRVRLHRRHAKIILSSSLRTPNYDLSNRLYPDQIPSKNFSRNNILLSNFDCTVVLI